MFSDVPQGQINTRQIENMHFRHQETQSEVQHKTMFHVEDLSCALLKYQASHSEISWKSTVYIKVPSKSGRSLAQV